MVEDEFRKVRALRPEAEKVKRQLLMAAREHPGPGSFYDKERVKIAARSARRFRFRRAGGGSEAGADVLKGGPGQEPGAADVAGYARGRTAWCTRERIRRLRK